MTAARSGRVSRRLVTASSCGVGADRALFGEGDDGINSRRSACRDGASGKGDKREDYCGHGEDDRVAGADAEEFTFQGPPERSCASRTNGQAHHDQQDTLAQNQLEHRVSAAAKRDPDTDLFRS